MKRRKLLGLVLVGLVLPGAMCTAQTPASDASVVVAGLSARAARELARSHNMLNQTPLTAAARRKLGRGKVLPPELPYRTLPERMLQGLPEVEGHEWRAAGIDLLLVNSETLVVAEILRGPLR